ncbi:hypothetical protein TREMEDRAFT_63217 [Tremella mesenterica DSM 1558]|uniref:uncharacterized protein n=1 Tax=Tremella mesenterica (strain ATCC 24925 / CBS 8224 / DSM 1558 / NBRC 9311 / NRRL Y-6157 / RJB 2259-6 / UBC 559-6) TaxID=578456 RepID=UPI0003F495DF|nr:uncharacterized protein TREMEDRAFT_63217 [Tremella mesenterica DSM 1558]EIW68758.1 hypothetical protein TREMEDRAFT_63217 [Tremella mesenterica DSM 1558]
MSMERTQLWYSAKRVLVCLAEYSYLGRHEQLADAEEGARTYHAELEPNNMLAVWPNVPPQAATFKKLRRNLQSQVFHMKEPDVINEVRSFLEAAGNSLEAAQGPGASQDDFRNYVVNLALEHKIPFETMHGGPKVCTLETGVPESVPWSYHGPIWPDEDLHFQPEGWAKYLRVEALESSDDTTDGSSDAPLPVCTTAESSVGLTVGSSVAPTGPQPAYSESCP